MMRIASLGDSAITISFSKSTSAEMLPVVWAAREAIEKAAIPGVIETVSSYGSVTVFVDPLVPLSEGVPPGEVSAWFNEHIAAVASDLDKKRPRAKPTSAAEIPVCFDSEFALDLAHVAATSGLTLENLIHKFCDALYQVACIGFTPGFPYLSGLPSELAVPRKPVPRTMVPAGSVAIGGAQAGIYPSSSPGGWNVIGRTPLTLFNPTSDPPSLLTTSDRVRFKPISRSEFEACGELPSNTK